MYVKSLTKLLVAFSASFLCALLAGVVALDKALLSPRGLGVFLTLVCLGGFVSLVIAFRRLATEHAPQGQGATGVSPAERRRLITAYKTWIVLLVLCLVAGVLKGAGIRPVPVLPMLVGIIINLLTTWVLARAVRRLSRMHD